MKMQRHKRTRLGGSAWSASRVALATAVAGIAASSAFAQTKNWDGGGSPNTRWDVANNWNANGVPTSSNDIVLDNSLTTLPASMTTDGLAMTTKSITLAISGGFTLGNSGNGNGATSNMTLLGKGDAGNTIIELNNSATGTFIIQPQTSGNRDLTVDFTPTGGTGTFNVVNAAGVLELKALLDWNSTTAFTKAGAGTLRFSGTDSDYHAGNVSLNVGTLVIATQNGLYNTVNTTGAKGTITVANNAVLQLGNTSGVDWSAGGNAIPFVTLNSGSTFRAAGGTSTYSKGSGGLSVANDATVSIGTSTASDVLGINSGIGSPNDAGGQTINITGAGIVRLGSTASNSDGTYNFDVTNGGRLEMNSIGANPFGKTTNTVKATSGTVALNGGATTLANYTYTLAGGQFGLFNTANTTYTNAQNVSITANNSTIAIDRSTSGTGVAYVLNGSLTTNGAYTVLVDPSVGASTNVTGGTTKATFTTGSLGGDTTFDIANPGSGTTELAFSGAVSGATFDLTKSGTGTLSLGAASTFDATNIHNGTLRINAANALPTATTVTLGSVSNGGILAMNGNSQQVAALLTSGAGTNRVVNGNSTAATLTTNIASGTNAFAGVIGGTGLNENNLALTKTGAGVLSLSGTNTYSGATTINNGALLLGASNVLSNSTAVTTNSGTLDVAGVSDTVASLTFGASGGTYKVAINGASTGVLSTTGNLTFGAGTDSLDVTMTAPTLGLYTIVDYAGTRSGTFDSVTISNSNYEIAYGAASNSSVDIQHKAVTGTVSATPATGSIITGGSTGVTVTVANNAPGNGKNLNFTANAVSNTAGNASGSAAPGNSGNSGLGLVFNGASVGAGQSGTFNVSAPGAINTPQSGSVSVDVYDHANGSGGGTISVPGSIVGFAGTLNGTNTVAIGNVAGFRANLKATNAGPIGGFSISTLNGIAPGASGNISGARAGAPGTAGAYSQNFSVTLGDDSSLNGALSSLGSTNVNIAGAAYDPSDAVLRDNGTVVGDTYTFDFGQFTQGSGIINATVLDILNVLQTLGFTAALDLDSIVGTNDTSILSTDLTANEFDDLSGGSTYSYLASFDTNNATGIYTATYTVGLSDSDSFATTGGGAVDSQTLTLTLEGEIVAVPEPASLGCLLIAAAAIMSRPSRSRQ